MAKDDILMRTPMKAMGPTALAREQVDLLKQTICEKFSDGQLQLFVAQCNRTQLDPFCRQIYGMVDRSGRMSVIVSIDGSRLIAARTGVYEGQTPAQWCGRDGQWTDVWLSNDRPAAARVGVYRSGFREATFGVATMKSYGKTTPVWSSMPDVMLAKCAESLALRKAFPNELSGLYTEEEMGRSPDSGPSPTSAEVIEVPEKSDRASSSVLMEMLECIDKASSLPDLKRIKQDPIFRDDYRVLSDEDKQILVDRMLQVESDHLTE